MYLSDGSMESEKGAEPSSLESHKELSPLLSVEGLTTLAIVVSPAQHAG